MVCSPPGPFQLDWCMAPNAPSVCGEIWSNYGKMNNKSGRTDWLDGGVKAAGGDGAIHRTVEQRNIQQTEHFSSSADTACTWHLSARTHLIGIKVISNCLIDLIKLDALSVRCFFSFFFCCCCCLLCLETTEIGSG